MVSIEVKKHGHPCKNEELKKFGIAKINTKKKGKYVPLIFKKSKKVFGRIVKSSLKKKKGTLSLGKWNISTSNKNTSISECMNKPCWHQIVFN